MMVPQTCPDGATLEIVFNNGSNGSIDQTITASLAGQQWTAGSSIIYQLSTSKTLKLSVKAVYPKAWTSASDVKAAYVNDDKLGMYVVDQNNSVIHANVPVTYNGSAWTYADNTVSDKGKHVQASPKYQYFFYYPYNATAPTVAPAASTNANTFFANKINNWKPTADQSSESTFNAQDLQVGQGVINGSATSFDASMDHSMGLAQITLGTKTIPLTRTFYMTGLNASNNSAITTTAGGKTYASKGIAAYMQYYQGQMKSDPITATSAYKTDTYTDADGVTHNLVEDSNKSGSNTTNSRSVTAAANFEGTSNHPCLISGKYYAVVKPSTATTFYSKDGIANGWGNRFTDNRVTANVAANSLSSYTAHSDSAFIFLAAAYSCAGKVEEFVAPVNEELSIKIYGASGQFCISGDDKYVGKGGYSYGTYQASSATKLFFCIGGNSDHNGYNGGTARTNIWGGGGGATHVALENSNSSNTLTAYASTYQNYILMVAGGGGGIDNAGTYTYGGNGGGEVGGDGSGGDSGTTNGKGGTQSKGGGGGVSGGFGQGGILWGTGGDGSASGGGGLYGGGSNTPWHRIGAAGGGSGFVNKSLLISGETIQSPHVGNGAGLITWKY